MRVTSLEAQSYQRLLDHVKEETYGDEPADLVRRQVTRHGRFSVVATDNPQGCANTQRLRLDVRGRFIQFMASQISTSSDGTVRGPSVY